MKSAGNNAAVDLCIDNDTFFDIEDDLSFNFLTPKSDLKPFLELIENDVVDFYVSKNKMVINNQLKVHFDDPSVITTLDGDLKMESLDYFAEFELNNDFFQKFNKIKKVANKFGHIYITVENEKLYIETTDKMNEYSSGLKFELCSVEYDDIFLSFPHNAFGDMIEVVYEGFIANLAIVKEQGGLIYLRNEDDSERYFLMSEIDT